jgi:hypothetical protein
MIARSVPKEVDCRGEWPVDDFVKNFSKTGAEWLTWDIGAVNFWLWNVR